MSWRNDFTHYPEVIINQEENGTWTWKARLYNYDGPTEIAASEEGVTASREWAVADSQEWVRNELENYRREE